MQFLHTPDMAQDTQELLGIVISFLPVTIAVTLHVTLTYAGKSNRMAI